MTHPVDRFREVIGITERAAAIRSQNGARLSYTRKPIEFNDVVLVDQIGTASPLIARER